MPPVSARRARNSSDGHPRPGNSGFLLRSLNRLYAAFAGALAGSRAFPPSLFIALSIGAAITLASSCRLEGGPGAAGIVLLALAATSLPPVYLSSLRIAADPGTPFPGGGASRVLGMLLLAACLAAVSGARVRSLLGDGPAALKSGRYTALVEQAAEKRYYREVIALVGAPGAGSGADTGPDRHRFMVRVSGGGAILRGDRIDFTGAPIPVSDPRCGPAAYRRALLLDGVRYVVYPDSRTVSVTPGGGSLRDGVRARLADNCDALFNGETAAIIKAFYFGNQDYIDKITMNDFRRAGVLHILSASGLHVAVVAAIPLFLLGLLRINRKATVLVAAATVALYLYLTDMPVSLLRACLMFFLFAAQRVMDRKGNVFNALFLSAAALLILFPGDLFSLGFQLSFGATLGILLFHGPYLKTMSWLPRFVAGPLAVTISAQVLVLPILLRQVGEVNLTGLVSNIVVVPLMSLLLLVSLAAQGLSAVTDAAVWAGRAGDYIYLAGRWMVSHLSALDGHFSGAAAGPALAAAFCLLLLPVLPRCAGKKTMSLSILSALIVAWLSLDAGAAERHRVTVVRHGQGTLVIVKEGNGVSVVGPAPGKEQRPRVISEIMTAGCREVTLVIPRPDYGSVAGYTYLAQRLPVRRCYMGSSFKIRRYTRRFFDVLGNDGVDLVIDDFPGAGGSCRDGRTGASPERVCALYERAAAGRLDGVSYDGKKYAVRYLTLH